LAILPKVYCLFPASKIAINDNTITPFDQNQVFRVYFAVTSRLQIVFMRLVRVALRVLLFFALVSSGAAYAQDQSKKEKKSKTRSVYFSWGYNQEWYTRSTVHVDQSGIGSKYDLVQVYGHDHKGWDDRIFHQQLSIPQYNYRLGCYFNKKQDLALEINFDHTKYIITDGQQVRVKGTLEGNPIDKDVTFSEPNGFFYYLNNGANFLLFNIVKRVGIYNTADRKLAIDLTGKAGIGPVVPHVQNSFFGHPNQQHFQLGGWNTGLETALRVTIMRYAFLEFSQKVDYARYSNLKIYNGTCKQAFGTYELILSAGVIFPTTKHNPLFEQKASVVK
jgi:hypothetical protein